MRPGRDGVPFVKMNTLKNEIEEDPLVPVWVFIKVVQIGTRGQIAQRDLRRSTLVGRAAPILSLVARHTPDNPLYPTIPTLTPSSFFEDTVHYLVSSHR